MKKILIFTLFFLVALFFLGGELNPFNSQYFTVHDNTQVARLSEFAFNLKNGIIPPRVAPHFSFNQSIPVFNFYAPFSYWIGGILSIFISPAVALKLLFLGGLLLSFFTMFLLISSLFSFWAGILSASVYVSSLWMAVEIFVRGNVGEVWFMALFPLALFFIFHRHYQKSALFFFLGSLVISATLTVHNVLSLVSLTIFMVSIFLVKNKKRAMLMLIFGFLLSCTFLVPALLEGNLTYANTIASKTNYADHFLCTWQLWRASAWSYGGSGIGCMNDDMSFQLGKPHIILGVLGLLIFFYELLIQKKRDNLIVISFFIFFVGIFSTFLTLPYSKPIWDLLSPVMRVFQFPWRFLPFSLFFLSYFAAYIITFIKKLEIKIGVVTLLSFTLIFLSHKFFSKPWKYNLYEYSAMFLSDKYIQKKAAYEIPEYFPRVGDYKTWRLYESKEIGFYTNRLVYKVNKPFYKEIKIDQNQIILPIHYYPFWEITIDGKIFVPHTFDKLGRPILTDLSTHSTIVVRYNETPIEKIGNGMSIISFGLLVFVCLNKKLWKKMNAILQ